MRPQTALPLLIVLTILIMVFVIAEKPAVAEPSLPVESLTLSPQADTHITNMYPNTNFGGEHYLELWYEELHLTAFGSFLLFRFELQEALAPEAIIDNATLELYQIEGSGPQTVNVTLHPILESWQENSVTWNNQPDVYTGPFLLATPIDNTEGWKQINVTQFADDWLAGDDFGIELRGPNVAFQRIFESSEHNEREPRLVVNYHLPQPTPTPTHTPTKTPKPSPTPTNTRTNTPTITPTQTPTSSPTSSSTPAITPSPTSTTTVIASHTPSPTPSTPELESDLPDLIITDLWQDGKALCLQIMNIGDVPNEQPASTNLHLDGALWDRLNGPSGLRPDERWTGCFTRQYSCTPILDTFQAVVDEDNAQPEKSESNNGREERWSCDQEPPQIIEGPVVEELGQESAIISWITDEEGDSKVQIGRIPGEYIRAAEDSTLVQHHGLTMTGLQPATSYHGQVISADASGNTTISRTFRFRTLPQPDSQRPSITLLDPGIGRGLIQINAVASDNRAISRVEFYLDSSLLFTDFSAPYTYTLDTWPWANGNYQLKARAFDQKGNEAVDTRAFTTDNKVDATKPVVTITSPGKDDTLKGEVTIKALLKDDTSLKKAVFYVDGINAHTLNLNGEKEKQWNFTWDSKSVEDGRRRLGIELFDSEDQIGVATVDVMVSNPPPPRPLFKLKSHTATRFANRLAILLIVENVGNAAAKDLDISDWMTGFIPQGNDNGTVVYDTYWRVPDFSMQISVDDVIQPGDTRIFAFTVIPTLEYPDPPQAALGEPLTLDYKDAAGVQYDQKFEAAITKTTGGLLLSEARMKAIENTNYLVISNPQRLLQNFWLKSFDILDTMGQLALERNGVVGLVSDYNLGIIDALITPPGNNYFYDILVRDTNWAKQMHPNFRKPLGGYVLLVGETEILPSYFATGFDFNDTAPESDNFYSDTGGDGRPELIVSRVIGDKPETLIATMENAIKQVDGEPGHAFEFNSALLVSGPPAGSFVSDINSTATILNSRLGTVDVLHADTYFQADLFLPRNAANNIIPHAVDDGLAVGDVLGGAQEEIILAKSSTKTVHIFDRQAGSQTQFKIAPFDGVDQDYFAAGDIRGDNKAEIILGDRDSNTIYIYNSDGTFTKSAMILFPGADMATGDVSGNTKDEIILGDPLFGLIWIGAGDPPVFSPIQQSFQKDDQLVTADLLGDDKDEIVWLDWSANKAIVLDETGSKLAEIEFEWSTINNQKISWLDKIGKESKLTAAKFYPGTKEGFIIAPVKIYQDRIFIYDYNSIENELQTHYEIGFTYQAGFSLAAGQVYIEPGESSPREELVVATNDNWIRILDTDNFSRRLQPDLAKKMEGKDIVLWSGHGNVAGWGSVLDSYGSLGFPVNFGGHHPVAFGISCLTGNYQLGLDYKNFAETLLANGAAVYIGATEESWGYTNREAALWLYKNWQKGQSIGEAFTQMERYTWDTDPLGAKDKTNAWRYWIWQYNLYGDPRFGAPISTTALDVIKRPQSIADLPTTLEISVPDYEIEEDAFGTDLDDVSIPGGHVWLEPGQLRLPYQTAVVELPAGVTVDEVTLVKHSGYAEETEVHIPITQIDAPACDCSPQPAPGTGDGWFPGLPFEWQVLDGSAGERTLIIRIYPLQYNPQTADVQFWSEFQFEIHYRELQGEIDGIILNDPNPEEEQPLLAEVFLSKKGQPEDLLLEGSLYETGSGALVSGLPLQDINQLQGAGALQLPVDIGGLKPGSYTLRLHLYDGQGGLQGSQQTDFQIGKSDLVIEELSANPRPVQTGEDVRLRAALRNSGSTAVDGTLTLDMRSEEGGLVATFSHPFSGLAPGERFSATDIVEGSSIGTGNYRLVVTAVFESQTRQEMLPLTEIAVYEIHMPVIRTP